MRIHFITIALDAMPWITHHLPVFNRLPSFIDWDWTIVEGVAEPIKDTAWCKRIPPRMSEDGTHQYLRSLRHPRVLHFYRASWPGKTAMFNYAIEMKAPESSLIWEIDADELWTPEQIVKLSDALWNNPKWHCADFFCRYFVGHNIVVLRLTGTWTNSFDTMWRRVWKYSPGMIFKSHEPPVFGFPGQPEDRRPMPHAETERCGCVFDHYAYVTEAQLRFKEEYYGYKGALDGWRRLQQNTVWPAKLRDFLPWIKDDTTARLLY